MIRVFSYGTLQDPNVQKILTNRFWRGFPAQIKGWKVIELYLTSGTYPCLIPGVDLIDGFVFELTEDELLLVDAYEGESYQRILSHTIDNLEIYLYICK